MTHEEMEIVEAMERWGGGFVQALAVCFRKADEDNFAKLLGTFGNYWYQYKAMAEQSAVSPAPAVEVVEVPAMQEEIL